MEEEEEEEAIRFTLISCDEERFEVGEAVTNHSALLREMVIDLGPVQIVPLPNVSARTLRKVIQFCEYRYDADIRRRESDDPAAVDEEIRAWEADFMDDVDQYDLYQIILAGNYMNIRSLLDFTCRVVAGMLRGKSPEEVRMIFNIKSDFSEQEEEDIRNNHRWAFED
eukprot:Gb_41410 [translate_table: standard]